jgi:predicted nucleic acid-binding protein
LREVISNTSPLQYLHQLGIDLPLLESMDWVSTATPRSLAALPLIAGLGAGEAEVLMLALEHEDAIVLLDDHMARTMAVALRIRVKGTLGILLEAKKAGLIHAVKSYIDHLDSLNFRLSRETRTIVLKMAGEAP